MDNDVEMSRKKRELKQSDKVGLPQAVGPFEEQVRVQKDKDPAMLAIDIQKENLKVTERANKLKVKPKNTNAPKAGPGRPADKGDPQSRQQKKKRDTKPQGMGAIIEQDLIDVALASRVIIDHYLKPRFLESVQKENLRQLTKDEKNIYNKLIESIWACTYPHTEKPVTEEFIAKMADQIATGKIGSIEKDLEVFSIYDSLVGEYRKENHRLPSERISRELFAKALVIRGA